MKTVNAKTFKETEKLAMELRFQAEMFRNVASELDFCIHDGPVTHMDLFIKLEQTFILLKETRDSIAINGHIDRLGKRSVNELKRSFVESNPLDTDGWDDLDCEFQADLIIQADQIIDEQSPVRSVA